MPVPLDIDAAIDRMGDRDIYLAIAFSFAESLPKSIAEIETAIAAADWQTARRLVHSLKGNCAALGADQTRDRVYDLEKACATADEARVAAMVPALRDELLLLRQTLLAL